MASLKSFSASVVAISRIELTEKTREELFKMSKPIGKMLDTRDPANCAGCVRT